MNRTTSVIFIFVILIGFIVRVYRLGNDPEGFFCDEAATGFNAYRILTTGTDEFGKPLPIFFKSFGNYRPGFPFYFTIPFVSLIGLSEFSTRLPSAIIGTMTIGLLFILTSLLFDTKTGLLASIILAVSPWHIQFSRYGGENIYMPFGITLSLCLYYLAKARNNRILSLLSYVSFGIFLYTYFPAFIIIPLLIAILTVLHWNYVRHNCVFHAFGFIVFFIIFCPFLFGIFNHTTIARFDQVSQITAEKPIREIVTASARTYVDHFLPEFLFIKGDIGYHTHFITRFSIRGMGELYWIQAPFVLLGLWYIFRKKLHRVIMLSLFLLYPVASTIAPFTDGGGPFATRSILGIIPFTIVTAVGLRYIHRLFGLKILLPILVSLFVSFGLYTHQYFFEYARYSNDYWGWQYGARDIMKNFLSHRDEYDELYLSGDFNAPQIFISFYDPTDYCNGRCKVGGLDKLDHSKRQLFAVRDDVYRKLNADDFSILSIVRYPVINTPAFYLIHQTSSSAIQSHNKPIE